MGVHLMTHKNRNGFLLILASLQASPWQTERDERWGAAESDMEKLSELKCEVWRASEMQNHAAGEQVEHWSRSVWSGGDLRFVVMLVTLLYRGQLTRMRIISWLAITEVINWMGGNWNHSWVRKSIFDELEVRWGNRNAEWRGIVERNATEWIEKV